MDSLTIILIAAVVIFVIAAMVLIFMLVREPSQTTFVPLPADHTQPGGRSKNAATTAMVVMIDGRQPGKRAPFRTGKVTIGRGPENGLIIDEPLVSRLHAEVKYEGGRFTLEDPGSVNGVWMKGQRVLQVELKDGDQFHIGRNIFALVMPGSTPPAPVPDEPPQPRVEREAPVALEGFTFDQKINEGGQATVYRARNNNSGQTVVIKYLNNLPYDADGQYFRMKFEQQIAIGTTIRHPNCVQIYGGNAKAEVPYLIEEYLPGGTLADRLRGGTRISQMEIARIIGQICDALHYLHGRGIIHRDIAPSNLMFDGTGRARLIDFGIARITSAPTRTALGMLVGKAKYMSVEQARGDNATPQSDLYSLGIIAYQMAVGRVPFDGQDLDVIKQHLDTKPPRPREIVPVLPEDLERAVLKALDKDPNKRFASARDMANAFGYRIPFYAGGADQTGIIHMPPVPQSNRPAPVQAARPAPAPVQAPPPQAAPVQAPRPPSVRATVTQRPRLRNTTTGAIVDVTGERLVLSRDGINRFDKTISRINGQVYYQNQLWWVGEVPGNRSQNGLYLNGARVVEPQVLQLGDTIRLGETLLEVIN